MANSNPSSPNAKTALPDKQAYKPFAEVIESTLSSARAQSWKWDQFPTFGSLVEVVHKEYSILGLVVEITTGSMDPLRYPFPFQKTEEELLAEQPQIFEFLKTTFKIQIVGYIKKNQLFHHLPPYPSKIHTFVHRASPSLIKSFFKTTDFLHIIFSFQPSFASLDELLLATLQELNENNLLTEQFLDSFYHTFSLLTGNDYRRLKLFLQRVEKLLNTSVS
jgi:hypothetical protein